MGRRLVSENIEPRVFDIFTEAVETIISTQGVIFFNIDRLPCFILYVHE